VRRKYRTIPTSILSTYLPKIMSFVPTGMDIGIKLLTFNSKLEYDACQHIRAPWSKSLSLNIE
jgi:hypothetical protein